MGAYDFYDVRKYGSDDCEFVDDRHGGDVASMRILRSLAPLRKEPKINLNQAVPEIPSQQALIVTLSRDLPAGVLLAVKEHIVSVANRPHGFYEQIAALPNVV